MSVAALGGLPRRHMSIVVLVVGTLAAAAAMARRQPLSWDEAVTVAVSTRPVHSIAATLHHTDAVLGFYYLLVHGWGLLLVSAGVRPTESWWRLPSAVAAVATCVVVASIARRHAGVVAGLWAGSLLAVLPLFSFYTVDARPYTLAAVTVVCAWAAWTRPGPVNRPLLSAAIVLVLLVTAAWLQLFTVLVWPAFFLVGGRRSMGRAAAVIVLAGCGIAPLLDVALQQGSEIGWIPPASATNTLSVAVHVGGGIAVVVLLIVVGVIAVRAGPVRATGVRVAVAWWCCAPLAILTALDVVRPVLVARYALVSLPMVAVVVGVTITRAALRRAGLPVRGLGAATLLAAVVTSAVQCAHPWKYEDYRGAAAYAARTVPAGTPVLFAPSSARLGFDVYAPPRLLRDVALPHGVGADPLAIAEQGPLLVREQLAGVCRVVVVGNPVDGGPAQASTVAPVGSAEVTGWHVAMAHGFGAITVTVLTNPVCAPVAAPAG